MSRLVPGWGTRRCLTFRETAGFATVSFTTNDASPQKRQSEERKVNIKVKLPPNMDNNGSSLRERLKQRPLNVKPRGLKPYLKTVAVKGEISRNIPSNERPKCSLSDKRKNFCNFETSIKHHQVLQAPETTTTVQKIPETQSVSMMMETCLSLSDKEKYLLLLQAENGIFIGGQTGNVIVVKDFDFEKDRLHHQKHVIVEREAKLFKNGHRQWVYWCSCNPSNSMEMSSLGSNLNMLYADFIRIYPSCHHITTSCMVMDKYDAENDIEPDEALNGDIVSEDEHNYSNQHEIMEISKDLLLCRKDKSGVFGLVNKELKCITCSKVKCDHTELCMILKNDPKSHFFELMENFEVEFHKKEPTKQTTKMVSFQSIPYERTESLACGLRNLGNIEKVLLPDMIACSTCGANLKDGDPVVNGWLAYERAAVVTNYFFMHANVYYRPCTSCDAISIFEGQSKSLLNMGTYLVGYDVLRSYLHSFLHGRRPLFTFYQTFIDIHHDFGNIGIENEFTYPKFLKAWQSYLKLLDVDFSEGFSCKECGEEPRTIVCDGTSLSFQRRMWKWGDIKPSDDKNVKELTKVTFAERLMIPDVKIRNLLKRFSLVGHVHKGQKSMDLTTNELQRMKEGILMYSEPLFRIVCEIQEEPNLHQIYKKLLFSLASPSPACAILRPSKEVEVLVTSILSGIDLKQNPVLWSSLHDEAPLFFEIFQKLAVTDNLKKLISEIWERSLFVFMNSIPDNDETGCTYHPDDELAFFPGLPKYRNRGTFKADCKKTQEGYCNKKTAGHPSLLPGVFTMFCPHGVCYGFQVMSNNESPNVPFSIFRTRFRKAPKHVIYDNACKLHQYCLNRDPIFFKNTEFYVDRLHWYNHSSCCYGYELSLYPQFDHINSQCNEQANSGLKRIKDQLSYMTASNFMTHCALYLKNLNKKKLSRI